MIKKIEIEDKKHVAVIFEECQGVADVLKLKQGLIELCTIVAALAEPPRRNAENLLLLESIFPVLKLVNELNLTSDELWSFELAADNEKPTKWQPQRATILSLKTEN